MNQIRLRWVLAVLPSVILTLAGAAAARAVPPAEPPPAQRAEPAVLPALPVYLVYYWRARPGKLAAYSDYIRTVAEPIDEEARRAGVFEEVRTYVPAIATGAPGADWTHMRVFRLRSFASWDVFSTGLDEAAKRVHPDEAKRLQVTGQSVELRDLARQEIWRDFR